MENNAARRPGPCARSRWTGSRVERKLSGTALSQQPCFSYSGIASIWARRLRKSLTTTSKPRSEWNTSPDLDCGPEPIVVVRPSVAPLPR